MEYAGPAVLVEGLDLITVRLDYLLTGLESTVSFEFKITGKVQPIKQRHHCSAMGHR